MYHFNIEKCFLIISKVYKYKAFKTSVTLVYLKFINALSALRQSIFCHPVPTRQKPQVLYMTDKDLWDPLPCLGLQFLFSSCILCPGNHKTAVGFSILCSLLKHTPLSLSLSLSLAFLLRHASTEDRMCSCVCLCHGYLHQHEMIIPRRVSTFKHLIL